MPPSTGANGNAETWQQKGTFLLTDPIGAFQKLALLAAALTVFVAGPTGHADASTTTNDTANFYSPDPNHIWNRLHRAFFVRTALRQRTHYILGPDTLCADGPAGTLVEWSRLNRLKLSYFSTKRDRSSGWMQLVIGSAGGRAVKVDSSLDGFYDIVERAARAAETTGLELSRTTRVNLRSMGISVAGQDETA